MRHIIILVLSVVVVFFGGFVHAADSAHTDSVQQQIKALQAQIKSLQSLIANLKLQQEVPASSDVAAGSYLALDISNNTVISEKNAGQEYPIASITKLMNAVIAIENINPSQQITLTKAMLQPLGYSPSIFEGLRVSAADLLKASLIQSTNDAAESLAHFIGPEKFLDLMNQKAKDLGMHSTHFYDVHGLNIANHSSASDLAILLAYIYRNHPEILTMSKDNDFWLPDPKGRLLKFKNVNNFYGSPEFIGGKTGYLLQAKQSLASVFFLNGKTVAIVVLYSKNRQADTLGIINRIKKIIL